MRLAMRTALFAIIIGIIKLRLSQAVGWCFPGSQTLRKIGHTPDLPYFWHREFKFDCKGGRFLAGVAVGYNMYYLGDKMGWRCTDGLTVGLYDNGTDYEDNERVYFGAGIVGVTALVDTGEIQFLDGTLKVAARIHNLRFYGTRFVWNGEAMVYDDYETETILPIKSDYDTEFMESRCPDNTVANGVYMLHTNYVWEIRLKCTKLSNVCRLPEPPDHRVTPAPTNPPTPQPTPYPTTLGPTEVPTVAPITPAPHRAMIPPGTVRTPEPTPSPTHPPPTQSPTRPLPKDHKPFFTKRVIIVIASTLGLILMMACIISYFCLTALGYVDPIKIYSGDDDNVYQPAQAPSAFRADVPDISDDWAQD